MNAENNELTVDVLYVEPTVETPTVETPTVETPAVETPAVETPAVETPTVETPPPRKPRKPREAKPETASFEEGKSVPIKKRKKASGSVNELAGILAVVHTTAFAVMGASHMDLSKEENTALAQALDNLADEYEITVDSKSAAWINLAMIAGSIYGARFFMSKPFQEWMSKGKNNDSTNYPA